MDKPREGVELCGVVADDPFVSVPGDGNNRVWSFPLRVETIHRLAFWQMARGTVRVRMRAQPEGRAPHYGERWRLAGVLVDNARLPPERPITEWINHRYVFSADPTASICLGADRGPRMMAWCFQWRRKAAECLARGIDHRPEIVGLMQALLLGYRHELPEKLRRDFIATGTYHIFAISGQHVAILATFIIVVLQARRVCRVKWFFYVAPVLILFTLSTGLSSSAVRGCLMALLVFLGPLFQRKPDLPSAMALAAILILAVDPLQFCDYGFLLSFGVVAGLIVFCPPMLKPVESWLMPDPWRVEPERKVVRLGRSAARMVALLLVSSLVAWLVSTPLIARWFNLVSPVALLTNLIVIPVSTLVLLAGCLSILCGTWFHWLGEVFNFANVALVSFLLFVTDRMARIPWGHFFVAAPPLWSLLTWFGALVAWLPALGLRKLWLAGPVILALGMLGSVILNGNQMSVDVANFGGMPLCLIKAPMGPAMLVHAGPRFYGRRVVQRLQKQGVNRLAVLVLPVANERYAGGALAILAGCRVSELWCVTTNSPSKVFRQVLDTARAKGVVIKILADDVWMGWRGDWQVQYQSAADEFWVQRAPTVLKIGWGQDKLGKDVSDMLSVARYDSAGIFVSRHIRCVEPGEVLVQTNAVAGATWVGLAPGQSLQIDLD